MLTKPTFAIIGGDRRLICLAQEISQTYPVVCCGTSEPLENSRPVSKWNDIVQSCDVLIFPMPFSKDGLHLSGTELPIEEVTASIPAGKLHIFGGKIPQPFRRHCEGLGIPCIDWMELDTVSLPNAVLTAEGAILEALQHTPGGLTYTNAAVLGYGRCGKALAVRLKNLCPQITVFARNPIQRSEAEMMGLPAEPLETLPEKAGSYGLLFNTIPAAALQQASCLSLSPGTVVLDLASGRLADHMDINAIRSAGADALLCPGLPGKYFPNAAGHILAQAVFMQISASS